MKFTFAVLILLAVVALVTWVEASDRAERRDNVRRIQACKDMGGHPTVWWHRGYQEWWLENCKL